MNKELTPLEALCYLDDIAHGRKMKYDAHELKLFIEEQLRALEIIKEKVFPLVYFEYLPERKGNEYRVYDNELYQYSDLTQSEYELLKEVLL